MRVWNAHRIRRDKQRPGQRPSRPDTFYAGLSDRDGPRPNEFGIPINPEAVDELLAVFNHYGKIYSSFIAKRP